MNTLTENIIWLRKSKNLSQQQLADEFNIKRSTLSAYEQGAAAPPIAVLQKYATFFQTDIEKLINQPLANINKTEEKPFKILALTVDASGDENIEFVPVAEMKIFPYIMPNIRAHFPDIKINFHSMTDEQEALAATPER